MIISRPRAWRGKRKQSVEEYWEPFLLSGRCRMKPDVRAAWSGSLRTGGFLQCAVYLTQILDDGTRAFSTLGVLCEVYRQTEDPLARWAKRGFKVKPNRAMERSHLPPEVTAWAGLDFDKVGFCVNPLVRIPHKVPTPFGVFDTIAEIEAWGRRSFVHMADLIDEFA